jgi:hypothetical protein
MLDTGVREHRVHHIRVACDVEWLPAAGIAPVARVTLLVASLLLGPLALLGI